MGAVEFRSHARALRDLTSSLETAARRHSALCWDKVGQVAPAFFKLPSMSLSQRVPSLLVVLQNQSIVQDLEEILYLDGRQFVDGRSIPTETATLRFVFLPAISRTTVLAQLRQIGTFAP